MKDTTKIELNKWHEIPFKIFFCLIIYTDMPENFRQKVGEMESTDRKQENWSLQIENRRTGVYRKKV